MGSLRCIYSPISPPFPFKLPPLKLSSTTLAASSSVAATPTHSRPPASSPRKRPSKTTKTSLPRVPSDTATAAPVAPATSVSVPPKKKVLVPIGYGTEEMEAVVIVDVLRRAGAEVLIASVEAELEVEGASGVRLVADIYIASCSDQVFDLVALPGGMPGSVRLRDCKILRQIATKQSEENRLLGAICAAPAVILLPWGLNRKKRMTCHPAFIDKLPTFWAVKSNIQVSGLLTTSSGPGTSYQFALSLVEQLFGESVAKEVEKSLLMNDADDTRRREEFNLVDWSLGHNPRVLIPVAHGSQDTEVVTIVDILRRAKVDVVIASVEKSLQILASRGTKIVADKSIKDAAESTFDLIILPGEISGTEQLYKCRILKKLLREQKLQGRIYGGTFSSPAMLQDQGLLEDMKATAHPSYTSKLTNESANGAKVVIDGKLITGKGLSTVADFALTIVSKLFGDARARSVAQGLVFDYRRS